MAYDNWDIQTLADASDDPGNWSPSTGTNLWALVDESIASPDTSDYISTTTNGAEYWMEANSNFSRDPQEYEILRYRVHARRVSGTSAKLWIKVENGSDGFSQDLSTSWATYTFATSIRTSARSTGQMDGTLPYTSNAIYEPKLVATIVGGATVEVATIEVSIWTLADHGYVIPASDGSTTNWTRSNTGISHYQNVDNIAGIGAADWANNDDTTDYLSTSTDSVVTELGLSSPTFTGLGAGDAVVVWCCHYNATAGNLTNAVRLDLIESGTSFTTQCCGANSNGGSVTWDDLDPRWTMEVLTLDSTPTSWANVQLRITSSAVNPDTLRLYSMLVIGPFDYAVATNYDVSITEAIQVNDTQAYLRNVFGAITEAIQVNDTQAAVASALGALNDAVQLTDAEASLVSALASITEDTLVTDLLTGVLTYFASITEAIQVNDTQAALASALGALTEGAQFNDSEASVIAALAALSEAIQLGDTESGLASAYGILAAEEVQLNDVLLGVLTYLVSITEAIQVGDSVASSVAALAAFTEALQAGDSFSATAVALTALTDGVASSEVFTAVAAAYGAITEGVLVDETWTYPLVGTHLVATLSIEPLLAATTSNQALLTGTVTVEGLEGATITVNR